jgi:hypothetical protein
MSDISAARAVHDHDVRLVAFQRKGLGDGGHRREHRAAPVPWAGERKHRHRRVDDPVDVVVDQCGDALEIPPAIGVVEFAYDRPRAVFAHRILPQWLIPSPIDQNPWAHWRNPMDIMRQGWSTSLFQASQQ